ncbi:winged helix-turn-helix transcriptional regulator, partial [Candidatus Parvarchaeota archaeon]|nr:winged helix-turn-helix transcriptional regulator [Candidatus Parvarchaeota archaeon]
MAEESFMLVSLKESKAKRLAQVISNETCRKILDFLSKNEATETELSSMLGMPISTVHYNLQHLVENKLVVAEEFHYSVKGKEVLHYKLANKLIIIAPEEASPKLMDRLKKLLPVSVITLAATFAVSIFTGFKQGSISLTQKAAMPEMARAAADSAQASSLVTQAVAQQAVAQQAVAQQAAATPIFAWPVSSIALW